MPRFRPALPKPSRPAAAPSSPPKLLALPNELLYMIRAHIPPRDLRTHTALQAVCRRTRALYAHDEAFWRGACQAAGVSRPVPARWFPFQGATWRELAICCMNHLALCPLEMCAPYECPDDLSERHGTIPLTIQRTRTRALALQGFRTELDLLAGRAGKPHAQDAFGDRRMLHAAALCKFASAPAVTGVYVRVFAQRLWAYNPTGLTQWDVVDVLREHIFSMTGISPCTLAYIRMMYGKAVPALGAPFDWACEVSIDFIRPYLNRLIELNEHFAINPRVMAAIQEADTYLRTHGDVFLVDYLLYYTWELQSIAVTEMMQVIADWWPQFTETEWFKSLGKYTTLGRVIGGNLLFTGLDTDHGAPSEDNIPTLEATWTAAKPQRIGRSAERLYSCQT